MKKLFAMFLAMVMLISMSVTAFAADTSPVEGLGEGGSATINISGKYSASTEVADKVAVDVAWGAMEFTYNVGSYWDASAHKTVTNSEGEWTASGNNITVTNHSNVGITAGFAFTAAVSGIEGKFSDAATDGNDVTSVSLERAEEGSVLTSQQATVHFIVTGGSIAADTGSLGTITVSIKKSN